MNRERKSTFITKEEVKNLNINQARAFLGKSVIKLVGHMAAGVGAISLGCVIGALAPAIVAPAVAMGALGFVGLNLKGLVHMVEGIGVYHEVNSREKRER